MTKTLMPWLITVALLVGCSLNPQSHDIIDVTKAEKIVLKKQQNQDQDRIHSLSIIGVGEIDGNAKISLILNDSVYKSQSLSGKVNFQWRGDWYSDEAEIRYEPQSVTGGTMILHYDFADL